MKQIDIEDDLYKYILNNIEAFGETPSQILRRLLKLSNEIVPTELDVHKVKSSPVKPMTKIPTHVAIKKRETFAESSRHTYHGVSLPDALAHGIVALFDSVAFQKEPVITNKFKMMLTTMYYENRGAFIKAAKVAKGRSRDYLGENLEQLLASSHQEEVKLLIASKPRNIPYTPFWVVTNANTGRKRIILTLVMASMGYPHHLIERIKIEIQDVALTLNQAQSNEKI
ncbi:MAG: replication initiation regulator SeqA [Psychromonas sp.]